MDKKNFFSIAIATTLIFTSTNIAASDNHQIDIPKPVDAQVFASFTDEIPAVVNYFSKQSKQDLLAFYQNVYGKPIKQTTEYGRLTSHYQTDKQTIRIAISQQNNARQVDVLIEQDKSFVKKGELRLIE